nr:XRE family transcriptional regulator [Streptomyces sp. SID4948]
MRALKDAAGLSLARLAERTRYSKSSWERYLNGKALPPQHAVISLGKLADADPARLMALWELANTAWHGHDDHDVPVAAAVRPAPEPSAQPAEDTPEAPDTAEAPDAPEAAPDGPVGAHLRGRPKWAVILSCGVLMAAGGVFVALHRTAGPRDTTDPAGTSTRQLDVACFADSCTGKDPKQSGCGDPWTAALTRRGRIYIELRYSDACKAAWARISWAHPGDIAQVVGPGARTFEGTVHYDTDNYSAMVAAASPSAARACALLTNGVRFCTGPGGTQHLTEAPNPPTPTP